MYSEYMENTTDLTELLYNKDHSIRQIRCAFADGYVVEHVFTQCGYVVPPYRRITLEEAIVMNTTDGLTAEEWAQRFLIEFVQKGVIVK